MTDKIEFGEGFTAEPRGDGEYYITHPNGGGAMASLAETALIRAVAAVRAERDALAADWDWLAVHLRSAETFRDAITGQIFIDLVVWDGEERLTLRAPTLRQAIAAARKQQEGGPQ